MKLFIKINGQGAADALFQRDERLGSGNTVDVLNVIVDQRHEVLVVTRIHLNHHGIMARSEMALDNLLDFQQLGNDSPIHGAPLKSQADERAGGVAQHLGIHSIARTGDDAIIDQALYALMNCSTRDTAYLSDILAGYTSIVHYNFQNLFIQSVNFFHEIKFW